MRWEGWGNLFQEEKISAKTQGMIKRNHEIFGVSKIWDEILKIYFTSKFFFFSREIYFKKFHPRFWKTPKIS